MSFFCGSGIKTVEIDSMGWLMEMRCKKRAVQFLRENMNGSEDGGDRDETEPR